MKPVFDPEDAPYWDALAQGYLSLQACSNHPSPLLRWPPGPRCPECGSPAYSWETTSGRGKVLGWVVYHRKYSDQFPPPYVIGLVELEEGPRLTAFLDVPPGRLDYDMRVLLRPRPLGEETPVQVFIPINGEENEEGRIN